MCAPIIINGGTPTGVLTLYCKRPRGYNKRELEFIRAMSSQIAIALDRTQLIERIQESSLISIFDEAEDFVNRMQKFIKEKEKGKK